MLAPPGLRGPDGPECLDPMASNSPNGFQWPKWLPMAQMDPNRAPPGLHGPDGPLRLQRTLGPLFFLASMVPDHPALPPPGSAQGGRK